MVEASTPPGAARALWENGAWGITMSFSEGHKKRVDRGIKHGFTRRIGAPGGTAYVEPSTEYFW